ncbi:MAG: L-threonylcarbamoyladenylate synthase, partial [Acidobacteriota bacterium]|nr:L-threonylcarbamoyladenylate synthase [Acidobacteriota bacterium]
MSTQLDEALSAAEQALAAGQLIVLPTDTVYGIAADALQADAVQALLDAKRRGRDMPPPVLISEPAMLRALVADVPPEVDALINRFWPGALTLIMKAQASLRMDLGRTEGTIAVRVPDHADARAVLRRVGPLAVSSANTSGQPPATTVDEAIAQLGASVSV